jgi:hypothetical protein
VFAAFKIIGTFVLACVSVVAAIVESKHPVIFGCASAAFVVGIVGSEALRAYRNRTVRTDLQ